MARSELQFSHTDSPPYRAKQLAQLNGRMSYAERDIDKLEAVAIELGAEVQSIAGATGLGDPGDLTLWYENGKTGGV